MRALLLLLVLGCQAKPAPVAAPKPSAAPSASAAPSHEDIVRQRKFDAIRHCHDHGGVVAMGYGFTVVCIEGQVREYDPETEKVTASSTYDYNR